MVKRTVEQNLRMKNFEARNGNYETSAVVKNQGTKQRQQRSLGDCWQWKADGAAFERRHLQFPTRCEKRAKSTQPNPSPRHSTQQNVKNAWRTRSPRGRSPSRRMAQLPCKGYLKGTCTNRFWKNGILQNACSARPRAVVGLVKSAHTHIVRFMNSLAKGLKRMMTKVQ